MNVACYICEDANTALLLCLGQEVDKSKYGVTIEEFVEEKCYEDFMAGKLPNGDVVWHEGDGELVSEWEDLTSFPDYRRAWDRLHTLHVEDVIPWDACAGNYDYYSN